MRPEEDYRLKKRSRRRKVSRGREIFMSFMKFLIILVLIVCLTVGGALGYQYWQGSRTPDAPLETSREVILETMLQQD